MGIPRSQRLRASREYEAVRETGFRVDCGAFIFQARWEQAAQGGAPVQPLRRLGLAASRRVGNAVTRNRAKRVFREIFRHNQGRLPARCEVVIVVRAAFVRFGHAELEARFRRACAKLERYRGRRRTGPGPDGGSG